MPQTELSLVAQERSLQSRLCSGYDSTMAEQAVIDEIVDQLPVDAATRGWTAEKIGELLDSGSTVNKVMLRYWQGVAAQTSAFVSVQESGSSRDLSTIHSNAVRMAQYWADRVVQEDKPTVEAAARQRARIYTATRI